METKLKLDADTLSEILDLQTLYKLTEIKNAFVSSAFDDIKREVLKEHAFYARESCTREGMEIQEGERITNEKLAFLMSKKDFDNYLSLCTGKNAEAGLTDKAGYYTEKGNTANRLIEIKNKLIDLAIKIIPDEFSDKELLVNAVHFKGAESYKAREKLLELMMQIGDEK